MAGWWMPIPQLKILRRMAAGEVLLHDTRKGIFFWEHDKTDRATVSAKALYNKNYIIPASGIDHTPGIKKMSITPTGKNEMGYNHSRSID